MTTWVIGDVHGCYRTLRRLLRRPGPAAAGRLWFVGDLVNRGPRSLDVLRSVADLGDRAVVVLGNHDLHFLARAFGVAPARRGDTLEPLLAARDLAELAGWLLARPLLAEEGNDVLVHAGLSPAWRVAEARRRARRLEQVLRGPVARRLLAAWRPGSTSDRGGLDREWLEDLRVFALLRVVSRRGRPRYDFAGPPDERPAGTLPWFDAPAPGRRRRRILFGHWAALGLTVRPDAVGLDTGCVWGGALTAMRLADRRIEQQENVE